MTSPTALRPWPAAPLVLGLETSGAQGGVALLRGAEVLSRELLSAAGGRHGRELHVALDRILRDAGAAPRDVDLVAVSVGPGSFTGLRLGVVAAKTWAYAADCRLAAVPTFEALAAPWNEGGVDARRGWVLADALRGDLFAQPFGRSTGRWAPAGPLQLLSAEAWLAQTTPGESVLGPAVSAWRDRLMARGLVLGPGEGGAPDPVAVARCGLERAQRGDLADPSNLTPLYVRRSAAEEQRELTAQRKGN
jgi:tRNA threonylcarbamoyladenosine biosynthesis protein TsaB